MTHQLCWHGHVQQLGATCCSWIQLEMFIKFELSAKCVSEMVLWVDSWKWYWWQHWAQHSKSSTWNKLSVEGSVWMMIPFIASELLSSHHYTNWFVVSEDVNKTCIRVCCKPCAPNWPNAGPSAGIYAWGIFGRFKASSVHSKLAVFQVLHTAIIDLGHHLIQVIYSVPHQATTWTNGKVCQLDP